MSYLNVIFIVFFTTRRLDFYYFTLNIYKFEFFESTFLRYLWEMCIIKKIRARREIWNKEIWSIQIVRLLGKFRIQHTHILPSVMRNFRMHYGYSIVFALPRVNCLRMRIVRLYLIDHKSTIFLYRDLFRDKRGVSCASKQTTNYN